MTRIIPALSAIADQYDVLYCDLWGCLHDGQQPYPAAVAALIAFRQGGGQVALMTNAPRPSPTVIAHLDRMGVPREAWDIVISSGDAAQEGVLRGDVGRRVYHLGPAKDDSFFTMLPEDGPPIERVPLDEAEGIVCTGLVDDLTETPAQYRSLLTEGVRRGLPLLCANPDIIVDLGDRRLYCAGAVAALYEELGGRTIYFGKPHAPIYQMAGRRLGLGPDARILCVGDGVNTDVAGAAAQGYGGLFVTGGLAFDQFGPDVEAPQAALMAPWLTTRDLAPDYAIGRLR